MRKKYRQLRFLRSLKSMLFIELSRRNILHIYSAFASFHISFYQRCSTAGNSHREWSFKVCMYQDSKCGITFASNLNCVLVKNTPIALLNSTLPLRMFNETLSLCMISYQLFLCNISFYCANIPAYSLLFCYLIRRIVNDMKFPLN